PRPLMFVSASSGNLLSSKPGLELDPEIELQAGLGWVGAPGRRVDVVGEVALGRPGERVEELVLDADPGALLVGAAHPEVAERERRDGRFLAEVLVEGEEGPIAPGLDLTEPNAGRPAEGVVVTRGLPIVDVVRPQLERLAQKDVGHHSREDEVRLVEAALVARDRGEGGGLLPARRGRGLDRPYDQLVRVHER